jgi:hypothetical protein
MVKSIHAHKSTAQSVMTIPQPGGPKKTVISCTASYGNPGAWMSQTATGNLAL